MESEEARNESFFNVLSSFYDSYSGIHAYLSSAVCFVGIFTNTCNIYVLTRPHMRCLINVYLTGMAICDGLIMTFLPIYMIQFRLIHYGCPSDRRSRDWANFEAFWANFSVTMHASSLWLSVILAGSRYHILRSPMKRRLMNSNVALAIKLCLATVTMVVFLATPIYLNNDVNYEPEQVNDEDLETYASTNCSTMVYIVGLSKLGAANNKLLYRVSHGISAIFFKVLPCLFLAIFISLLLKVFRDQCVRRESLGSTSTHQERHSSNPSTAMLTSILLVVWMAELPHAVVSVLAGIYPDTVGDHFYNNVADIFDIMSLVQSLLTFVLYCLMSRAYRREIALTLCVKCARKLDPIEGTTISLPLISEKRTSISMTNNVFIEKSA